MIDTNGMYYQINHDEEYFSANKRPKATVTYSEYSEYPVPIYLELLKRVKLLEREIERLQAEHRRSIVFDFDVCSFEEAKTRIKQYIERVSGEQEILDVFQLSQSLRIPADMVEDVLELLSESGDLSRYE